MVVLGALYEFRESEKLEKWVNEQTKFVEHESAVIDKLQKENLRLIGELERLKLNAYDTNAKTKPGFLVNRFYIRCQGWSLDLYGK